MLEVALAAARSAADIVRAAAADPAALQVHSKRANDFVTQVDFASEQAIMRTLRGAFPDHAVRSEESPHLQGPADADHVWIVDPLDGTTNFIHGYPVYAVSIALAVRGRVEHGVVLDVARGDVFHASLGDGARCNGQPLRVAPRTALRDAVVATSCPCRPGPEFAASMQMLGAVMERVSAVRRSGSAALDLAWVAAGRCDAMFDLGLNAWDVAAGGLLVSEAGGEVSDFLGDPDCLDAGQCLAGNPALRAELGAILRHFAPRRDPPNRHRP